VKPYTLKKKPKHPKKKKKRENTRNQMERLTMPKKTKEPPKRANHKGNIKFPIMDLSPL
jgi:hypothetical protein